MHHPSRNSSRVRTGDGIVERLLGEVASEVGSVHDLIVEHREVEGQTKTDGVSGSQIGLGNLGSVLVGFKRFLRRLLALVADGELGQVAVVVTLPAQPLAPTWCISSEGVNRTSCGRTPWTLRTRQRG